MTHKISQADFADLLQRLWLGLNLDGWQRDVVEAAVKTALTADPEAVNTREFVIGAVKATYKFVDPTLPRTVFVEYVGRCMNRPQRGASNALGVPVGGFETEAYASGWLDDGWNVVFPEHVLRAYFPELNVVEFDGNFHKLLLSSSDLKKTYKQLARKYHPDLNSGRQEYFLKLKKAYDDLQEPVRRKRYEAGLRFQQELGRPKDVEEILFRVPKSCGHVTIIGTDEQDGRLHVSSIVDWQDVVDDLGRVMVAKWNRKPVNVDEKPFTHEWETRGDIEFEIAI